jgi:hypothetical protein
LKRSEEFAEDSLSLSSGTKPQRIVLALAVVALLIYAESAPSEPGLVLRQQIAWTVGVLGILVIELRNTLKRFKQAMIGVVILVAHVFVLYEMRRHFPFASGLSIIAGIFIEAIVLGFIYLRLGQALDPDGPLGFTEAEKRARDARSLNREF